MLRLKIHPDKNPDDPISASAFNFLNTAILYLTKYQTTFTSEYQSTEAMGHNKEEKKNINMKNLILRFLKIVPMNKQELTYQNLMTLFISF